MQPPDPSTVQGCNHGPPSSKKRTLAAFSKAGAFGTSAEPTGSQQDGSTGGGSLDQQIRNPSAAQGRAIEVQDFDCWSCKKAPGSSRLGRVPVSLPEPRLYAAFPSLAPRPRCSQPAIPLQQPQFGSRAEGEGLRQLCGLQFSSSQAPDLRREAGEAGITAGWSCSMSRGKGNKTRVDYIPLETLRKKTQKIRKRKGKQESKKKSRERKKA